MNNIPLSLYIHIPWCIKKCPYCDFNSHQPKSPITQDLEDQYTEALILDLKQNIEFLEQKNYFNNKNNNRFIHSIFIGGGTPSLFSAKSINNILTRTNNLISLSKDCEITLEANPGTFESQKFTDFKSVGVNRLSIGVQSFDNQSLKLLGRIHDSNQARTAIHKAKELDFNLNIDLMHSLPEQTQEKALLDLQTALSFEPNHLSWYQLTIEPNTAFAKNTPALPHDNILDNIYYTGLDYLRDHNFEQYEISAFVNKNNLRQQLAQKLAQKSAHNINYWRYGDYIGIGAGAHGKFNLKDSESRELRVVRQWKQKSPIRYLESDTPKVSGESQLTQSELILEYMMNRLRLLEPISSDELFKYINLKFEDPCILKPLNQALNKNWISFEHNILNVTNLGRRFLNDLILLFI